MIAALTFSSCQQDTSDPAPQGEDLSMNTDWAAKNLIAKTVAKNIADNINSESLRQFIKEQSLIRFDGDDNFLISKHLDHQISSNNARTQLKSFSQIISGSIESSRTTMSLIDSLILLYPLLQVSVVVPEGDLLENWDTNLTPIVAFVPLADSLEFIPAYDSDGNYLELSTEAEPDQIVIVISGNERLIEVTSAEANRIDCSDFHDLIPYYASNLFSLYLKEEYYSILNNCTFNDISNVGNDAANRIVATCNRDENSAKDNLRQMKFNSKNAYRDAKDGWFNNDFEFQVDILSLKKMDQYLSSLNLS